MSRYLCRHRTDCPLYIQPRGAIQYALHTHEYTMRMTELRTIITTYWSTTNIGRWRIPDVRSCRGTKIDSDISFDWWSFNRYNEQGSFVKSPCKLQSEGSLDEWSQQTNIQTYPDRYRQTTTYRIEQGCEGWEIIKLLFKFKKNDRNFNRPQLPPNLISRTITTVAAIRSELPSRNSSKSLSPRVNSHPPGSDSGTI